MQEAQFGRDADPAALAELLLGGLIKRCPVSDQNSTANPHFQLVEPARAVLQHAVDAAERRRLADRMQDRLTDHLDATAGRVDRTTLVAEDAAGALELPPEAQPIARMIVALRGGVAGPARRVAKRPSRPRIALFRRSLELASRGASPAATDVGPDCAPRLFELLLALDKISQNWEVGRRAQAQLLSMMMTKSAWPGSWPRNGSSSAAWIALTSRRSPAANLLSIVPAPTFSTSTTRPMGDR